MSQGFRWRSDLMKKNFEGVELINLNESEYWYLMIKSIKLIILSFIGMISRS